MLKSLVILSAVLASTCLNVAAEGLSKSCGSRILNHKTSLNNSATTIQQNFQALRSNHSVNILPDVQIWVASQNLQTAISKIETKQALSDGETTAAKSVCKLKNVNFDTVVNSLQSIDASAGSLTAACTKLVKGFTHTLYDTGKGRWDNFAIRFSDPKVSLTLVEAQNAINNAELAYGVSNIENGRPLNAKQASVLKSSCWLIDQTLNPRN